MEERNMDAHAETFGDHLIRYQEVTQEQMDEYQKQLEIANNSAELLKEQVSNNESAAETVQMPEKP